MSYGNKKACWYKKIIFKNRFCIGGVLEKFFENSGYNINSKLTSNGKFFAYTYAFCNFLFQSLALATTLSFFFWYPRLHIISENRYFSYILRTWSSTQLQISCIEFQIWLWHILIKANLPKLHTNWPSDSAIFWSVIFYDKLNLWLS